MTDDAKVLAVALLRVPEWDAPDEVDVRFLEDGALVFLPVDFAADAEDLIEELLEVIGDAGEAHDDERGVFFFPDWAEPDEAESYDAVIAAVGANGKWASVDEAPDLANLLGGNMQSMLGQAFEAMGISDPEAFAQAMQSGDPEARKLAQIQMQSRMEEMMRAASEPAPPTAKPKPDDEPKR